MRYNRKKAAAGLLAAVMTMVFAAGMVSAEEPQDKTVYVITDASGSVAQVIDPSEEENETTTEELPVAYKASYELDGKSVLPEELAGKSGHVTIRMEYSNQSQTPFVVLTGMVLDDSVFSDVQVTNGKLLSDGSRMLAVGAAFPGLSKLLDIQEETISIPEEFVVEADVTDFKLNMVYSVAMSGMLGEIDESQLNQLDTLAGSFTDLETAMGDILTGAQGLADGADSLNTGLTELASHNTELTDGAALIFDTVLSTVQEQIAAAGLDIEPLTRENYQEILYDFTSEGIEEQAREQVEAQVDALGDALYATYLEGQKEDILGAYFAEHADDVCRSYLLTQIPEEQVTVLTQEQLDAALNEQLDALSQEEKDQILTGAREQITEEEIAQIMTGAAAALTQEQKDQIREGAVEQGMASEEVQAGIQAAEEQAAPLQAALEQLNSYQTFYTGLIDYTEGVQTAAVGAGLLDTGAASLKEGLDQFDTDGIQVLADMAEQKLQPLLENVRNMQEQDQEHQKYIYKMGSIEELSE